MTTQRAAAESSAAPTRSWGASSISAADIIKKIEANDPSLGVVDISNNAIFQMKSDEYSAMLGSALKGNTYVRELNLVNCSIGDRGAEFLGDALSCNRTLVSLNLEKNSLNQDGASAIARGLIRNTTLESINLMNQTCSRWGDKCLDDFLDMFNYNMTLLKINWRLESRKSFALNKMITRNNEIDRRKKNGIAYDDLLPVGLRGTELEVISRQGRPPGNSPLAAVAPLSFGSAGSPVTPIVPTALDGSVPSRPVSTSMTGTGEAVSAAAVGGLARRGNPSVLSRWPPAASGNA